MGTTDLEVLRALVGRVNPTVIDEAINGNIGDELEARQALIRSSLRQELILLEILEVLKAGAVKAPRATRRTTKSKTVTASEG